jgi:oxygen-independent coproporphyrinogen-3 oxidase
VRSTENHATPTPDPGTPLYVHLPFCAAKCHYCDFFSLPGEGQDIEGTVRAVLAEARRRAPHRPRTVYIGGGTPSLLDPKLLEVFLDGLDDACSFRSAAEEVTVECNPESLDREKARCLLDLGATRLSIGFQSLHDDVLQLFGRVHSVADSFRAFAAAREAGVRRLSVDLIFAAPGQTPEAWERDLGRVLDLEPDHLSAYNLTYEEETLFKRWLDEGRLARQPEEAELAMFEATRRIAAERGLAPYEVSNFSTKGQESLHNLNYWRNGPYVGVGPSAVSKVGHRRFGNLRALAEYRRRVERDRDATQWEETPEPAARLGETWWLGLRVAEGLAPPAARERAGWPAGPDAADPAVAIATGLLELGLLELDGDRYRLTARGWPVADAVAREFLTLGLDPTAARSFGPAPRHENDSLTG